MSCRRRNATQAAAIESDLAARFDSLEGPNASRAFAQVEPAAESEPPPVPVTAAGLGGNPKVAAGVGILLALSLVVVSVVSGGTGNAPQRPSTGGGLDIGIKCALCNVTRSKDMSRACKGCARKAAGSA